MKYIVVVFLCSSLLVSCTAKRNNISDVVITFSDEPARIRYSGKGSGAGMMLMGSMGPMGIAVGVAIDEGIAKDIDKAFVAAGYDPYVLVRTSIERAFQPTCEEKHKSAVFDCNDLDAVELERFALKSAPGNPDYVAPDLQLRFQAGKINKVIHSKSVEGCDSLEFPSLDLVKKNGELSANLLADCLTKMLEKLVP